MIPIAFPCFRRALGLSALLVLVLASGCSTVRLKAAIGPNGEPIQFKRYERYAARDFMHHFSRSIYSRPGFYFKADGDDQSATVAEWGRPDFIRRFRSMNGEKVREWVYADKPMIMQFVGGELVFAGPVSDLERTFLTFGRPDNYEVYKTDAGGTNMNFVYQGFWFRRLEDFKFNNDKLVFSSEGN